MDDAEVAKPVFYVSIYQPSFLQKRQPATFVRILPLVTSLPILNTIKTQKLATVSLLSGDDAHGDVHGHFWSSVLKSVI